MKTTALISTRSGRRRPRAATIAAIVLIAAVAVSAGRPEAALTGVPSTANDDGAARGAWVVEPRLWSLPTATAASSSNGRARAVPGYGWPVRPFHAQHPIRGFFGDPRIGLTPQGMGHSFHFGVDVVAANGTSVYATTDGVAGRERHRPETVTVRAHDGRTVFSYWHITPLVANGTRVRAYRTILGRVNAPWAHVHLAELRDGIYLNPLRGGALGPYADSTRPAVTSLRVEVAGRGAPGTISGSVDFVVEAVDRMPVAAPEPWRGKPVTPALLRWRLLGANGRPAVTWQTAVDFRRTIPDNDRYTAVYARGTNQNKAYRSGRYRFYLVHEWNSSSVRDGSYQLQVSATDSCGNTAVRRFPVQVANDDV